MYRMVERVKASDDRTRGACWNDGERNSGAESAAPAAASEGRRAVAAGDPERAARWGSQRGPTERCIGWSSELKRVTTAHAEHAGMTGRGTPVRNQQRLRLQARAGGQSPQATPSAQRGGEAKGAPPSDVSDGRAS